MAGQHNQQGHQHHHAQEHAGRDPDLQAMPDGPQVPPAGDYGVVHGKFTGGHHVPAWGGEDWDMLTHLGVAGASQPGLRLQRGRC